MFNPQKESFKLKYFDDVQLCRTTLVVERISRMCGSIQNHKLQETYANKSTLTTESCSKDFCNAAPGSSEFHSIQSENALIVIITIIKSVIFLLIQIKERFGLHSSSLSLRC